jgi:hypothetical protein
MADAHRGRFLADAEMAGSGDLTRFDQIGDPLFEAADQYHSAVHLEAVGRVRSFGISNHNFHPWKVWFKGSRQPPVPPLLITVGQLAGQ